MEKEENLKYDVSLKFINMILVNLGKEKVKELTDFKDIDRENIIKDINKESLKNMVKELKYLIKVDQQ